MTIASNSYAEKVYAEHPLALWTLDEPIDYVSAITENDRNMSLGWTFTDQDQEEFDSAEIISTYLNQSELPGSFPKPVMDSVVNQIAVPNFEPEDEDKKIRAVTSPILSIENFDDTVFTFAIGLHLYTFGKEITVSFGFEYTNELNEVKRLERKVKLFGVEQWEFVSRTFPLPKQFDDMKIFIEIEYDGPTTDYFFLVHGLTVGQWSEQFHTESLGVGLVDINYREPGSARLPLIIESFGTEAGSYGLRSSSGYYLSDKNMLRASTAGLPMVFGASNSTVIKPNPSGLPSLVLPGYGFMNQEGQYSDLTLEFWLKVQSSTVEPRKIVGPIASEDGLYVNDAFFFLKVGERFESYFVSEWDRPMLLQIRLGRNAASLLLNGEEVISFSLNTPDLDFPAKIVTVDGVEKDQDWIAFYAYEDVPQLEVDCVGIYPYTVPKIVAKRRWVYGQGVAVSENIKGSDIRSTINFDYPVAGYAKNYSYPDLGRWRQGVADNFVVGNRYMSLPQYELPEFKFDNRTYEEWLEDVKDDEGLWGTSLSLRPEADNSENTWESVNGYMLFKNLNMLDQQTKAFYAVFEPVGSDSSRQTLFYLENSTTKEILEISLQGEVIEYVFKSLAPDGTTTEQLITSVSDQYKPGTFLFLGIDIQRFTEFFGGRVSTFFGSRQNISVYVGGSREFQNTYSGKIYRVGFCSSRNLAKIASVFSENGIAASANDFESDPARIKDGGDSLFRIQDSSENFVGPYTPISAANEPTDPPTTYWEEMLNGGDEYFGNLNSEYDLVVDGGGVQSLLIETVLNHIASYTLIPKKFLDTYILDIGANAYWQDYVPLSYFAKYIVGEDNEKYYDLDFIQFNVGYPAIFKFLKEKYDTSRSIVRTYVSFQPLSQASTIQPNYYAETEAAPENGSIEPKDDWINKKYEIVNDMVIYPPPNIDFQNVALVLHIEVESNGIIENPVRIQTLQLASQVLNPFSPNPIGTKFGTSVFPYKRSGAYYDYKGRNPFTIYKGSTPYLYLTGTSGMRLRGFGRDSLERGITIPINRNAANFYRVSALQMAIRYDGETFPQQATEIAEVYAKSRTTGEIKNVKFYLKPDSSQLQRGVIYAIDGNTGLPQDGIVFYVNGIPTINPVINLRTWTLVSLLFNEPVQFDGFAGALRITGPILFDNISQYQTSQLDETSRTVFRRWSAVLGNNEKWYNWYDSGANPEEERSGEIRDFTWRDVLFISTESSPTVDGRSIYKKYTGVDRIVFDSDTVFKLGKYRYALYSDIVWRTTTTTPV
jgi:hypothetical protein